MKIKINNTFPHIPRWNQMLVCLDSPDPIAVAGTRCKLASHIEQTLTKSFEYDISPKSTTIFSNVA